MLTKEECLKALCRIQCGAKRNKKCEDCKCFDTKINPWKCVENTNESLIIRDLIEEHFNPKPFNANELRKAFDESKYGAIHVYDKKNQVIILITELTSDGELFVCYTLGKVGCSGVAFEENRFYPIQIPMLGENQ